jgi:hypothetical protein
MDALSAAMKKRGIEGFSAKAVATKAGRPSDALIRLPIAQLDKLVRALRDVLA